MGDMIMKILQPDVVKTIFWSGVIFLLLCHVFGLGILRRFFLAISDRDERTAGDAARAQIAVSQAQSLQQQIDSQLIEARIIAMSSREKLINSAKFEHDEIVSVAQRISAERMGQARASISSLRETAVTSSGAETKTIATNMVDRLITTAGSPSLQERNSR